ncbi:terminase large subunit domain-containing protein [Bauldia litoralis]|uniref:terminase large subunit domain-containing protein n=1 Tax=Bauldia litoralis TaxID=665467 RepID=UPI003266DB4A
MLIARDLSRHLDPVIFARDCGIEPDPWQAELLRAMPRRALLLCSRQSGKTTTTALMALHRAVYDPGAPIVVVSPSQRQSAEMLRTVKGLLGALDGAPDLAAESALKIELATGSRIIALPGTERTIRGLAGVRLAIVDEAARVEDELLAAIRPMLATSNGSLVALTTPAGQRGFFYESWHGDASWHRVRVSADECPRITKEFLDEEMRELGPTRFSEEYGLAFIDSEESAFPTTIIDNAFTGEVLPLWA